ncbi:MAG: ABC transporter ATP-binding protein [Bacteroidales bacterium]|nr:ABC transporter ATP-binding protein [Bacteroidales bacterium]
MIPIQIKSVNLTKRFGDQVAVDHINLEVHPGEILGFLGPNGAGKTTAIRMICGLLRPDEGEVLFNGQTLHQFRDGKSLLGVCPQDNVHWERLTCLEQMVFNGEMYNLPRKTAKSRSLDLLDQLGLSSQSDKQARKLSGGMKRRLNIALALVHNPAVLILDEPEAGLDPQSRILMREFIRSLAGTRTIILTTHTMDEADRLSNRVAIIDQGKILMTDTPENLKHSIGTHNTLQINLDKQIDDSTAQLFNQQFPLIGKLTTDNRQLMVQCPDPMQLMPLLLESLSKAGFHTEEIKLRENTLEDVFIQLTGKTLRS